MNLNETIKILLASDSKLFLEGIHRILEGESNIKTILKATSRKEIEKYCDEIKPEFVIIDNRILQLNIPKLLKFVNNKSSHTKVIILNDQEDDLSFPNAIFISKETNYSELLSIIKGERLKDDTEKTKIDDTKHKLTKMELKIVKQITAGFSNKEIANKLSIKEKTVKAHLTNIYIKLDLQNRYQLIVYGKQHEHD